MTEKNRETISALVDDELHDSELRQTLEQLAHSAELRAQWRRHNLISDALHGNLSAADSSSLQARVWQALEQEPTVLAPRQRRVRPIIKHAVGMAIAASVATIAILTLPDTEVANPDNSFTTQIAQVNRAEHNLVQLTGTATSAQADVHPLQERLNPYLVNHNEYSVSAGMQGVLPYARLVSQESRY